MPRDPQLNSHFMNYVATCLRQGVSPQAIRDTLHAMGDMSDRSIELFLDHPDLRALAERHEVVGELTPRVDAEFPAFDATDARPSELIRASDPNRPIDLVLDTPHLANDGGSDFGIQLEAIIDPRPRSAPSSIASDGSIGSMGSISIESPLRKLANDGESISTRIRRRARGARQLFSRLHRRTHSMLETVTAYCMLALLIGLLALQLVDRVDPITLVGAESVAPTSAGRVPAGAPAGVPSP